MPEQTIIPEAEVVSETVTESTPEVVAEPVALKLLKNNQ